MAVHTTSTPAERSSRSTSSTTTGTAGDIGMFRRLDSSKRFSLIVLAVGFFMGRTSIMMTSGQKVLRDEIQDGMSTAIHHHHHSSHSSSNSMQGAQNRDEMIAMCTRLLNTPPPPQPPQPPSAAVSSTSFNHTPKNDDTKPPTVEKNDVNAEFVDIHAYERNRALAQDTFPDHPLCRLFATTATRTTTKPKATTKTTTDSTTSSSSMAFVPSAMSLWMQHLDDIHAASQLDQDKWTGYKASNVTTQLLELLSPRLPLSVKSGIRDWTAFDNIMKKAYRRYMYLTNKESWPSDEPPPQPIKILVLGGSVTMGINCWGGIRGVTEAHCKWSFRLQSFINELFYLSSQLSLKEPILQVESMASGGTNTAIGTTILKYDIISPNAENPDIIINAYATNDMHVLSMEDAKRNNKTLEDAVFDSIQDFFRVSQSLDANKCNSDDGDQHSPLVIHFNEYLGNEQNEIYNTMAITRATSVLSAYYGFPTISSGDMIRDIVYGDTMEKWFSPPGWYQFKWGAIRYGREIHPSGQAHQTMMFAIAYNLLNLITTRCNMVEYNVAKGSERLRQSAAQQLPYNYSSHEDNKEDLVRYKPHPVPKYLPPKLTKYLSLQNVSDLWKKDESKTEQLLEESRRGRQGGGGGDGSDDKSCYMKRCPFSWISGTNAGYFWKQELLEAYFANATKEMTNWSLEWGKWKIKTGFVPEYGADPADNQLIWEFGPFQQQISSISLVFMKSYGEKWDNSTVRMDVMILNKDSTNSVMQQATNTSSSPPPQKQRGRRRLQEAQPSSSTSTSTSSSSKVLISHEFQGFHEKKTSEQYSETIELPTSLVIGDTLRTRFTLLDGNSFKIMGILVCS